MTALEALEVARAVLGPSAVVSSEVTLLPEGEQRRCSVGTRGPDGYSWRAWGSGPDWPSALREATPSAMRDMFPEQLCF